MKYQGYVTRKGGLVNLKFKLMTLEAFKKQSNLSKENGQTGLLKSQKMLRVKGG